MRDNTNKLLFFAGLILSVGAVAYAINTGGTVGGNGPLNPAQCFLIYFTLMIAVLLWVVECSVSCDPTPEGGRCRTICIRRALIMYDILTILLFLCIGGHMF